jgi:hypothetical protein
MTEDGWTPLHVSSVVLFIKPDLLTHCSSPLVDPRQKSALSFYRKALLGGYVILLVLEGDSPPF